MTGASVPVGYRTSVDTVEASRVVMVATIEDFVAVEEPGGDPLVGDRANVVFSESGLAMFYGDGGAGKTTLANDLAFHLAAGDEWLGIPIPRARRVLLIELEGPRSLFRAKLRRKLRSWRGSPIEGRILVWEEPWADFTFTEDEERETLAAHLRTHEIDVVIVGPLTAAGMEEAGTLQDVRAFAAIVNEIASLAGRRVAILLIHHENKGGKVSGAWEACGETLVHVQALGHGRTRLHFQKARWASDRHATSLELTWTDGEGFALEEREDLTEETIADAILLAVRENPGASWTQLRALYDQTGVRRIRGNEAEKARVRDRLLEGALLVNGARAAGQFRLWLADDPAAPRSEPGTGLERVGAATPDGGPAPTRSPVPPVRGNGERNGTGRPGSDEHDSLVALAEKAVPS